LNQVSYTSGGLPAPPPTGPSSQAVVALVLAILSVCCCNILAPFAWILGNSERRAIREGRAPAAGDGYALAAVILGIIGTCLLGLVVLWVFLFGGLAILQGLTSR
jgi:L-lactate permease